MFVRVVLIATFAAVVISDLAECQPFSHYWQVLPDPGGRCRQGYAHLLTMAVCNVLTDLLLVLFPVPVVLRSSMTAKRKLRLILLFSLSLAPVAVTIYRVPHIIRERGSQQARSLYASVELLFATAAANALVLGSFVRDRGVKKRRFKYDSIAGASLDRSSASEFRRPAAQRFWGSDEDLVRDMGYGVARELRDTHPLPTENRQYIPAPVVKPHNDLNSWRFPTQQRPSTEHPGEAGDKMSSIRSVSPGTHRRVSFFDYGGLLADECPPSRRESTKSSYQSVSPTTTTFPAPAVPASENGFRRGSTSLLQDLGGFLIPPGTKPEKSKPKPKRGTELQPMPPRREPSSSSAPHPDGTRTSEPQLMDVGGLLGAGKE